MRTKKGFTLIETIVVIGVFALTVPAVFAILMSVIQAQVKTFRLAQVKKEGDAVIRLFETKIRNDTINLYDSGAGGVCNSSSSVQNQPVDTFNYSLTNQYKIYLNSDNRLYYQDSNGTIPLTSANVRVDAGSDLITCSNTNEYTYPTVTISFNICYINDPANPIISCDTTRPLETASLNYQATVQLRAKKQ